MKGFLTYFLLVIWGGYFFVGPQSYLHMANEAVNTSHCLLPASPDKEPGGCCAKNQNEAPKEKTGGQKDSQNDGCCGESHCPRPCCQLFYSVTNRPGPIGIPEMPTRQKFPNRPSEQLPAPYLSEISHPPNA